MPQGSMRKFFANQQATNGEQLSWPGTADGFPFRGPVPDIRADEYQDIPLALDYQSRRFCLWDEKEHAEFNIIMDRIINGWYMQHRRIDRWSDDQQALVVWLEWAEIYGEVPYAKHPGMNNGLTVQQAAATGYQGVAPASQNVDARFG